MSEPLSDRKPDEACGNCRYFTSDAVDTKQGRGWCSKHPRMNQKTDDRTWSHLWCMFYTKAVTMDEHKREVKSEDPVLLTSEDRPEKMDYWPKDNIFSDEKTPPPLPSEVDEAIRAEVIGFMVMLREVYLEQKEQVIKLLTAEGKVEALIEMRGALKTTEAFIASVQSRLDNL